MRVDLGRLGMRRRGGGGEEAGEREMEAENSFLGGGLERWTREVDSRFGLWTRAMRSITATTRCF
jgi:hypothetical protein